MSHLASQREISLAIAEKLMFDGLNREAEVKEHIQENDTRMAWLRRKGFSWPGKSNALGGFELSLGSREAHSPVGGQSEDPDRRPWMAIGEFHFWYLRSYTPIHSAHLLLIKLTNTIACISLLMYCN